MIKTRLPRVGFDLSYFPTPPFFPKTTTIRSTRPGVRPNTQQDTFTIMNVDYKRRMAVMQSQQVQPQLQPQRRAPLSTTNNVQQPPQPQQQTPPKPPPKGASPPLPRQNSKTTPPTPPKVIVDRHNRFQFTRVGFLGEGGFARVFEVQDPRETRLACKVITKTSLKTKKAKTKVSIVSLRLG